jgi:formylglycine-generating enzyme required for sulfatase activity
MLEGAIDRKLPADAEDEAQERLAKRRANAAIALLRMGRPGVVWPLLKHNSDPRVRSYLIDRLGPHGAQVKVIANHLDDEPDVAIRQALLQSLGHFGEEDLPSGDFQVLLAKVQEIYRTAVDPGLHASAEWLLRIWKQEAWLKQISAEWEKDKEQREKRLESIVAELAKDKERAPLQWYVNSQGQTMVVIPGPVEFKMGSPLTESGRKKEEETQQKGRIDRSYAIAAKEVTVEQFRRFYKDYFKKDFDDYHREYSPTGDSPVNRVSWYQAAAYCNWLSQQEGRSLCYEGNMRGEFDEGMKLVSDYSQRTGYRLPTEAEWEYACRAGTSTSRYYGESEELLGKYACYLKNSLDKGMLPGVPGRIGIPGDCLKPSEFGLFDMLGNALEFCQDEYMPLYQVGADKADISPVASKSARALRGGSFFFLAPYVRSASRFKAAPTSRNEYFGFRPAMTIVPN